MQLLDCGHSLWFDLESKARRKTNGTQHAQVVFLESFLRIPDCTDYMFAQIMEAPYVIHDVGGHIRRLCQRRIQQKSIDCEIPAQDVLFRIRLKSDLYGMPAVHIRVIAAKRGDFHAIHQYYPELC